MQSLRYTLLGILSASALALSPVQTAWATDVGNEQSEPEDNSGPDETAAAAPDTTASDNDDETTCAFVVADANNDGHVSYGEARNCFPSLTPAEFGAVDKNADLALDQGEWSYVEPHV